MKKPMVKLNTGKSVPLEEFVTWAPITQNKLTLPEEKVKAIKDIMSKKMSRAVITPKGEFPSVKAAYTALKMNPSAFGKLLKNTAYPEYRYVDPRHYENVKIFHKVYKVGKKETVTPIGTFKSQVEAANALGIPNYKLRQWMAKFPEKYYFSTDSVNKSHEDVDDSLVIKKGGYKRAKKVVTPMGTFDSKRQAALAYFLPIEEFKVLLESNSDEFYFLEPK